MFPTLQKLTRFGQNLFIDVSALDLVRFDDNGEAAHLMFKDGKSATVQGKDASQMRSLFVDSTEMGANGALTNIPQQIADDAARGAVRESEGFLTNLEEILSRAKKKAWFYRKTQDGKHLILACANVGGSCSVRLFDAHTALAQGIHRGKGRFREHFTNLLEGATELTVRSQPNLARDCKHRLPEPFFANLRQQIDHIA